jgi:hypothetical protein
MSTIQDHSRWFELSDGIDTVKANVYDCLGFTQDYSPIGGSSVIRMMSGSALKQTNWQRLRTQISGSGGLPFGFSTLDYSKQITIKCAVPRAIVKPTNSFITPVNSRSDTGYTPTTLKLVDGFWVPLAAPGVAAQYKLVYFPQLVCFMEPPEESTNPDTNAPISWSLTAEEA